MSEPNAFPPPTGNEALPEEPGEALQFDQAEFATPASAGPACTVCKQPIAEEYYELSGKVFCARCRQGVEAAFRGGSPFGRAIKALVLGSVAAAVGAVIYFAITRASGYNLALISILVGFMVGGAVRKGSGNRGGPFYQSLAIFLTYSSIVAMNVPFLLEDAFANLKQEEPVAEKAAVKTDPDRAKAKAPAAAARAEGAARPAPGGVAKESPEKVVENQKAGKPAAGEGPPPSSSDLLLGLMLFIGIFYAYPIWEAFHAPIAGLIYGFALWEAWKINRRLILVFNGPFRLGTADSGQPAPEVTDNGQ